MKFQNYNHYLQNLVGLEWAIWDYFQNIERGRYIHTSLGHEKGAFLITSFLSLNNGKWCLYYRSHAWLLGLGFTFEQIINELKYNSKSKLQGKCGTMNLILDENIVDCNSIVGGQLPISVGSAIYSRNINQYTICVLGDGATNTGAFYESINIASLYNLPIIFVVEDNQRAITEFYNNTSKADILKKFETFSINTYNVNEKTDPNCIKEILEKDFLPKAFVFSYTRMGNHAISMGGFSKQSLEYYNFTTSEMEQLNDIYLYCSKILNND